MERNPEEDVFQVITGRKDEEEGKLLCHPDSLHAEQGSDERKKGMYSQNIEGSLDKLAKNRSHR